MLRANDLFDSAVILDPDGFNRILDEFSLASNYFYHGWDFNGKDNYPEFPISVEHDAGGFLVWIMGLAIGNRAGKALLVGATKVRGFKDTLHSGFEVLPGIPAEMNEDERKKVLQSLRKRMRFGTVLLARRSGMIPFNGSQEYPHDLQSLLPDSSSCDCEARRR